MDNRTGVWVVFEALRRAAGRGPSCSLCAASTVQEEIGLRGARTAAYAFDPHVAIAVDVTHATDCPTIDKRQRGVIELGKGPVILRGPNVNPRVGERLLALAMESGIPHQVAALGRARSRPFPSPISMPRRISSRPSPPRSLRTTRSVRELRPRGELRGRRVEADHGQ